MPKTPRVVSTAVIAALTLLPLAACSSNDSTTAANGKILVATTVAPLTSITANIAGDRASVQGIVPEGTNSHTFEPAPKVAQLLSKADLIIVNGLKLEDPTKELAQANKKDSAQIVEVGTAVLPESDYLYDFSFPKADGKPNPHLWTDPTYAKKYAAVIATALEKADPKNADYYAANNTKFAAQANELTAAIRADQKSVPRRVLLTYHDAYAYFGKTFDWQIIGAVQPKNFEDPTPQEIARIIDQVKAEKVPTIFGSEVFPSSVLQEIGKATGARYEDTLRDDDLPGEPGSAEHSWLGLMTYDFTTMVKGLGGQPTRISKIKVVNVAPDEAVYPQ